MRSLIEDIKDVRFHKIGTGLEIISERTYAVKVGLVFILQSTGSFLELKYGVFIMSRRLNRNYMSQRYTFTLLHMIFLFMSRMGKVTTWITPLT